MDWRVAYDGLTDAHAYHVRGDDRHVAVKFSLEAWLENGSSLTPQLRHVSETMIRAGKYATAGVVVVGTRESHAYP